MMWVETKKARSTGMDRNKSCSQRRDFHAPRGVSEEKKKKKKWAVCRT